MAVRNASICGEPCKHGDLNPKQYSGIDKACRRHGKVTGPLPSASPFCAIPIHLAPAFQRLEACVFAACQSNVARLPVSYALNVAHLCSTSRPSANIAT